MLMTKIMGFHLSKAKRKVIRSSSIHFCWLFLCKILSYVSMFTIQKREFLLFNFLFSIDCKHKQMGTFFSSADKLSSSWSFLSRHCADPGWSQSLLNLAATRQAEHFALLRGWIQRALPWLSLCPGWLMQRDLRICHSILRGSLCQTVWYVMIQYSHVWAFCWNCRSQYRNTMHGAI